MKVIRVDAERPQDVVILSCAGVVSEGGVIVYPTDTVYGIGCILSEVPVERVYSIKGRVSKSPLSVAFAAIEDIRHYTFLSDEQEDEIERTYRDGMTFLLKKRKDKVPDFITAGLDTVGVRIPDSEVCRRLIRLTGPITTTSANISGFKPPTRVKEADEKILDSVDIVLDAGPCRIGKPSRIVDLTNNGELLRD